MSVASIEIKAAGNLIQLTVWEPEDARGVTTGHSAQMNAKVANELLDALRWAIEASSGTVFRETREVLELPS